MLMLVNFRNWMMAEESVAVLKLGFPRSSWLKDEKTGHISRELAALLLLPMSLDWALMGLQEPLLLSMAQLGARSLSLCEMYERSWNLTLLLVYGYERLR